MKLQIKQKAKALSMTGLYTDCLQDTSGRLNEEGRIHLAPTCPLYHTDGDHLSEKQYEK